MSRPDSELAHLFRQLKAPAAARALPKLADRARQEEWTYERFAATLLKTETDSRDSHGGQSRIKAARFPARKTLEEFDFAFQHSIPRNQVLHLGQLDFLAGKENVVLLGPPGTGKTHLSIALGIRACLAGHRVAFRTATEWVALLADAQRHGRLDNELDRLQLSHTRIHAGRPQTNGNVEALHKTILDECWRPAFARYIYPRLAGLRRELN